MYDSLPTSIEPLHSHPEPLPSPLLQREENGIYLLFGGAFKLPYLWQIARETKINSVV